MSESTYSSSSESSTSSIEPLFNYSRLSGLPKTFFNKDPVSAVLVTPKFFAFGTHSGVLHLAKPDMTPIRTIRYHRASISSISADKDSSFVATASIDGTVVIASVEDDQDVVPVNFRRPVHALALNPQYATTKSYLSGGTAGTVTLSEKGWIKARSDTILFQSLGTILTIAWRGSRAVWCSEDGITVYDSHSNAILERFSRPPSTDRADLYKPEVTFTSDDTKAIVSWERTFWVIDVIEAKIVSCQHVPWLLSGIACYDENSFIVLCCPQNTAPELRVIDFEGNEVYVDELSLQGYDKLGPNDYHLARLDDSWYIVSATDAVVAARRQQQDHIEWLLEHGQYEAAYEASTGFDDHKAIGLKAAQLLADQDRWVDTAELLSQCLDPESKDEWKSWSQQFFDHGQYIPLGDHVPSTDLGSVHTDILLWCSKNDLKHLDTYLESWDLDFIDKSKVVRTLEKRNGPQVYELLAKFYLRLSEPYNAVKNYLLGNEPVAFDIVVQYHLWNDMMNDLPRILRAGLRDQTKAEELDEQKELQARVDLLAQNHLEVSPGKVVAVLKGKHDDLLFLYLESLSLVDEFLVKDFGNLLVRLYAEHSRDKLLAFLTHSETYDLNYAIEICQKKKLVDEQIYLYGRVGQTQKALNLIINDIGDPHRAVHFVISHSDNDLWDYLIKFSRDKPDFVLELLKCQHVPAAKVLEIVPHTLKIPGLREALYNVLKEQRAVMTLNEGALSIVKAEARAHLVDLQQVRRAGSAVDVDEDKVDWSTSVLITPTSKIQVEPESHHGSSWLSFKVSHLGRLLRIYGS